MVLTAVTPTSSMAQVPQQTGYFRNPLPMSDGSLVAVHTPATDQLANLGTTQAPNWSYYYRLKLLTKQSGTYAPSANLTPGVQKNLSWWTPDVLASYSGPLWELDPVEVVSRTVPTPRSETLPDIETQVFADQGVDIEAFRSYLRDHQLALIVSRNVTQRDRADRQQPFNLRIPGGVSSIATSGQVYDVAHLQIFQGDPLRGYGDPATPSGRRLLARPMHEDHVSHDPSAPLGAVKLGLDGSMAALVPARRALSWQLIDPNGAGVVRERNWLSFQAGEIRVCASCHGINTLSQTGAPPPTSPPQALRDLLDAWKQGDAVATPVADPAVCLRKMRRPQLVAKAANGKITLSAKFRIPKPWTGVAPPTNGMRIALQGLLDETIPGGPSWTTNATPPGWTFVDPAGSHGGVRRVDVLDQSSLRDGQLLVTVRFSGAPIVPSAGALDLTIGFGGAAECASALFAAAPAPSPSCVASGARLVCQ
jgi:hypothetical protein